MNFVKDLTDKARQQRTELESARLTVAQLVKDERRASAEYQALQAGRSFGINDFFSPELDRAQRVASECADRLRRQQDLVRVLEVDLRELEMRVRAPETFQQARNSLEKARAETVAAVARRDKVAQKIGRLQAQREAELAAAEAGRLWQAEVILAQIEQREPVAMAKPEHAPDVCQQTADLIDTMIGKENQALAAIDQEIANLRGAERGAEQDVLQAAVAVRELELAEALAAAAPAWVRLVAAYRAADVSDPVPPDWRALGEYGIDEALAEARHVLQPTEGGGIRRMLRRAAEMVA